MRILLTGGTGYLGGRIAARLRGEGHAVRILVRDPVRARRALDADFETVRGDLSEPASFPVAVRGMDAVVHTAAAVRNWLPKPEVFEQVNVAGSFALCEAALEAGVGRFVYTSSFFALGPSTDGRPLDERALAAPPPPRFFNGYHSTKYRAARVLQGFVGRGLPLVTLFPSVIFGPGAETDGNHVTKIFRWLQTGRFPGLVGGGVQKWNVAFVEDVVTGHLLALEKGSPGDTFILGGEDKALRDIAGEAAAGLGVPAPTRSLPYGVGHAVAGVEEMRARLFGGAPMITHGEVDIYRHDWIYSSRRAEEQLGYRRTPFPEALRTTLDWIRETKP